MQLIYLDNAATTKPNNTVLQESINLYSETYYNPSALYGPARKVKEEIEKTRSVILSLFTSNYDLIFTSGGTESDNISAFSFGKRGNIVTTLGEHSAVYNTFNQLKQQGAEPRFAKLNNDGSVNVNNLLELVDDKTTFVSVVHVNNETGAINDVNTIAKLVKQKNPKVIFHSDGVQAFLKIPYRISNEIDLYSISAHKIGALKGCGALIFKKTLRLKPMIFGGGQEKNYRSGTENTLGIFAFGKAVQVNKNIASNFERVKRLKQTFIDELANEFVVVSNASASPYIISISVPGIKAEIMQRVLEDNGVIVGTGSACSAKLGTSRIITNCGLGKEIGEGVLRISLIYTTTEEELIQCAKIIKECANKLKVTLK